MDKDLNIVDFVLAFASPAILGKILVIYFGMNYSSNPGEGYGYGLVLSIVFTIAMLFRFLYRYRNYKD